MFAAFLTRADLLLKAQDPTSDLLGSINLLDPMVLSGLFIGAVSPALFTAMTMKSVGSGKTTICCQAKCQSCPIIIRVSAFAEVQLCK